MAQQFYGSPFQPYTGGTGTTRTGTATFTGAGSVRTLSATAGGGTGPETGSITLPSDAISMYFSVSGGTVTVTRDGSDPSSTFGIAYAPGVFFVENSRQELAAWRMYIAAGTTVAVEYGKGRV
jgi:hypothetical protein